MRDDLGGITQVCRFGGGGGGETKTEYVQSPEARQIMQQLLPVISNIYGSDGKVHTNLYKQPTLGWTTPTYSGADVKDYIAGGKTYQNVYDQIAPSLWQSYESNVENPLINRFAGSGSLGSPIAGLSGASADALEASRRKAGNDISSQAYTLAQAPLTAAMNAANTGSLAQFTANADNAKTSATSNWQSQIQEMQYPFQILPGLLGGTMPTPVTTTSSGGKK